MSLSVTEESIRPSELMERKRACVDADRRYLLDRAAQWVEVDCPACGDGEREPWGEKEGFRYAVCTSCGTVYTSPRPDHELLSAFYRQSANYAFWNAHVFPATELARRESIFRPRAERLRVILGPNVAPVDRLLDVGAAFGTFCLEVMAGGAARKAVAMEPTPDLAETCRRRGLEVIESPLESVTAEATFDVVTAFEVLEHVFDPGDFIRRCRALLRPSGLLVVSCPNVRGFAIAELGVRSGSVDHEHLNYFHPDSLSGLLKRCEMEVVECATPGVLDAELVRRAALRGEIDLADRPLLEEILLRRWESLGEPFQRFLAENLLSSHLWIVARRPEVGRGGA